MYRIDLENYNVPFERWKIEEGERKLETGEEEFDVRKNIKQILRVPGIYDDGIETCDGVDLANRVLNAKENYIDITSDELELMKKVFNKLIKRPHNPSQGQISLGGDTFIPLIRCVFKAEKI